MRILVVGAGAIGGYFGGRLLEAGCDITFLLRPKRAAQVDASGLVITSPFGNAVLRSPRHVAAGAIAGSFDLIVVACKAYDLAETMESFAPAVGADTSILPLLNGMRHIDDLSARFGAQHVLGGLCMISSVLDPDGTIVHLNNLHAITFGELTGSPSPRTAAIHAVLSRARFDTSVSAGIVQELWEKWTFIAAVGCIGSLMRAPIGDIVAAGAADLGTAMYEECRAIAALNNHAPREASVARTIAALTAADSRITASLLKDVERGGPTEAEHIVGDLIRRGGKDEPKSLLRIAYANLRAYEIRREAAIRLNSGSTAPTRAGAESGTPKLK